MCVYLYIQEKKKFVIGVKFQDFKELKLSAVVMNLQVKNKFYGDNFDPKKIFIA